MFLIKTWSLEDCFPRLFLVARVWISSLSPGSNPNASISDLGNLELNLYLEAKKSSHSLHRFQGMSPVFLRTVKLFEQSESYKRICLVACRCVLLLDEGWSRKPLNFLRVSKERTTPLCKSTHLKSFLILLPCSATGSPMQWCSTA